MLSSLLCLSPLLASALASAHARADAYDYIIVGGGTAGNTIAARLSQGLASASILVIEAGPFEDDNESVNIPGKRGGTLNTPLDWNFTSIAQTAIDNRTISVNRAKFLGGCSGHNGLLWNRGSKAEYDAWETLGNEGWNWDTISAAMLKSENWTNGPSGSGLAGPINVVTNRWQTPMAHLWAAAVEEGFGYGINNYSLQGDNLGTTLFGPFAIFPEHYNASYSTNAYLPMGGDNLVVMPDTTVARVNLALDSSSSAADAATYRATGVTLDDGTVISASREVILAAGAIQSPQLLELSGVGQAKVLDAAGIDTLIELDGVGENYQDHPVTGMVYEIAPNASMITADSLYYNATLAAQELDKWYDGALSMYDTYGAAAVGFVDGPTYFGADENARLAALARSVVLGNSTGTNSSVVAAMRVALLDDATVPQIEMQYINNLALGAYPDDGSTPALYTVAGVLEHPLAVGSVHVDAADPAGKPVIDPNWMSNEYDRALAASMSRRLRSLVRDGTALSAVTATEYYPGFDDLPADATEAEWRAYVRGTLTTGWHSAGTAAMLPRADGGVVDANLTVYGTANLRVADASIIPLLVSGHPTTLVYGIGEMAADKIIAAAAA